MSLLHKLVIENKIYWKVLAKALSILVDEVDLAGRRAKKEKLDEIE